ncbi:hypothetical protein DICA3_F10462 [Diutina catenulata]
MQPFLFFLVTAALCKWFPLTREGEVPSLVPYPRGQEIPLDCIQRNIDNGEHKFDDNDRIIYGPFPMCKETGRPLAIRYGVNEDINCTVHFSDELYHLFQLYIHEDAPFSCRMPFSNEKNYIEAGGAHVPLTFNFRGSVSDSKIEIDTSMNVLLTGTNGGLVSAVAWGAGTDTTRVIIDQDVNFQFAVRWGNWGAPGSDTPTPFANGWYKLPARFITATEYYASVAGAAVLGAVVTLWFSYRRLSRRAKMASWDEETKHD